MVRIGLVTDTFAPATNGVVRSVETTTRALREMGADVRLFAPGSSDARRANDDARVRFYPSLETRVYPDLRLSILPIRPAHLRGLDVVHIHTPGPLGLAAAWAARQAGIPFVYTYHTRFDAAIGANVGGARSEAILRRASARLERFVLERAAAVVAPSPAIALELSRAHGIDAEIAPTGVDTDAFRPMPRLTAQPPTFLHLGRVAPEKNLEAVLRAFPRVLDALPSARLQIGGSGPDAARCKHLAWELGIERSVDWLGFVPEQDLSRVYASADVFVSASLFETQGLTVLESLASGTPAALAACDVFLPVVASGAAVPFDAADANSVAMGMVRAYDERHALARSGLRYARAHSTRACAERLLRVYGQARSPMESTVALRPRV